MYCNSYFTPNSFKIKNKKMRWRLLFLSFLASKVNGQCDPDCNLREDMANHPLVKCGISIGNHPIYGKKCIYLTKTR